MANKNVPVAAQCPYAYTSYFDMTKYKTNLSTKYIKELRAPIIRSIDFLERNKACISQEDYKNLFDQYQHILNVYNNMIDRNVIQSKYIDPRTVVQTQPIIDGAADYDLSDWEKQFTANNLQIQPYSIPPINTFRQVKDQTKYTCALDKKYQMQ